MKALAVLVIAAAGALALGTISAIWTLASLSGYIAEGIYCLDELAAGQVHQILLNPITWREIPVALGQFQFAWLISLFGFLMMASLAGGLLSLWRFKGWRNHTIAGLLTLVLAVVPWSVGMWVLADTADVGSTGPWLHMMLASLFYACSICIGLCTYDLFRRASPA